MNEADFDIRYHINPPIENWTVVHGFLNQCFAYMRNRIDPPSSMERLDPAGLKRKAEEELFLTATCSERLVGCVFLRAEPDHIYVGKLAVDQKYRRGGVAKNLMKMAAEQARAKKLTLLELETRVELIENHRTFERMGFVKISESAHAGYDRPTSIRMRLNLAASHALQ